MDSLKSFPFDLVHTYLFVFVSVISTCNLYRECIEGHLTNVTKLYYRFEILGLYFLSQLVVFRSELNYKQFHNLLLRVFANFCLLCITMEYMATYSDETTNYCAAQWSNIAINRVLGSLAAVGAMNYLIALLY
jgi:hypothetical protein